MHPGIVVGNVIVPRRSDCTLLPGACRVVGLREHEVGVIPILWDEARSDPPAPFIMTVNDLSTELHTGVSAHADPSYKSYAREEPTERAGELSAVIQKAFAPLISDARAVEKAIFDPSYRAVQFKRIAERGLSVSSARRYFNRYLIFNFTERAFVKYSRSEATAHTPQVSGVKRGRCQEGVPLHLVRKDIANAITKFYVKERLTAHDSWVQMLLEDYPGMCEESVAPCGKKTFTIRAGCENSLPTIDQFRYVIRLMRATHSLERVRPNANRLERPPRATKGSARDYVDLPGAVFQSDATKLQVRVVASWDRSRVLCPVTLYAAIDVATTVISGWLVSPENPSTALALRLLKQCGSSKQADCERLDIEYAQSEWVEELCSALHADRGEWVSIKAQAITRGGIAIKVGEPYEPEQKAGVEQTLNLLKEALAREGLPGLYKKQIVRGDSDGIDGACLTLLEIERRIAKIVRKINLMAAPNDVIPPGMLAEGHRDVSRIAVWKWRIQNEPGAYRRMSEKQLFEEFLVTKTASVTDEGLLLNKRVYRSPVLHQLGWTAKAARRRSLKVNVFIEERLPGFVYFVNPLDKKSLTRAECRDPAIEQLKLELWELGEYEKDRDDAKDKTNFSASVNAAIDRKDFKATVAEAKASARRAIKESGTSRSARKKGRKEATAIEAVIENANYEGALVRAGVVPMPASASLFAPNMHAKEAIPVASQVTTSNSSGQTDSSIRQSESKLSRFKFVRTQ